MTVLKGSEKQVKWATDIKAEMIATIEDALSNLENAPGYYTDLYLPLISRTLETLQDCTSAVKVIDRKNRKTVMSIMAAWGLEDKVVAARDYLTKLGRAAKINGSTIESLQTTEDADFLIEQVRCNLANDLAKACDDCYLEAIAYQERVSVNAVELATIEAEKASWTDERIEGDWTDSMNGLVVRYEKILSFEDAANLRKLKEVERSAQIKLNQFLDN